MDIQNIKKNNLPQDKVHKVLAHSSSFYFILLLFGVALDLVYPIRVFNNSFASYFGFLFLGLAPLLIIWAQKTGRDLKKVEEKKVEHFCRGQYCYTRIPTQWGLFFLILGFGIIANAFFVILFTVISFFISKFVFMDKHDRILLEKYGEAYAKYKKLVRF